MKILLIDPPPSYYNRARSRIRSGNLNLGLAVLASGCIARGHQVALCDMANHYDAEPWSLLGRFDLVGIAVTNATYNGAMQVARKIRELSKIPIALGGPEVTADPRKALSDSPDGTSLYIGEAEDVFPMGVLGGRTIQGPLADPNVHIPNLGIFGVDKLDTYKIMASRGCPHSCSFCFNPHKRWRPRDPKGVVNEIFNAIEIYGCTSYMFIDPAWNMVPQRAMKLCEALLANGLDEYPWKADGLRADHVTDELCEMMVEAGCTEVGVGVESIAIGAAEAMNKGEDTVQILEGLSTLLKHGFKKVSGGIIIGLPHSFAAGDYEGYKYLRLKEPDKDRFKIKLSLAVPYTATAMADWVKKNAYILGTSFDSCTRGTAAVSSGVSFETPEYPAKERMDVFKRCNTKEGRYTGRSEIHRTLTPLTWLWDVVKYDPFDWWWHLKNMRSKIKASKPPVTYKRIPDGTWFVEEE